MQDDELLEEIERRLAALRDDPQALLRYDANGDGVIDEEEWEEVRRVITAEVQTELRRADGNEPDEAVEPHTQELLQDRYRLIRQIGRGGQGRTYLATDKQTDESVAIKELELRSLDDWKAVELFEREGQVLRTLNHGAIPSYVDTFHLTDEESGEERFFLVQEYVDGQPLDELIDAGLRMDEDQAIGFLREMLEILTYLHGLSPAVIHRDIKPSNIMRRTDQSLALIDFGAVQAVSADDGVASTVVGTSGYMPLEQLMGRATPATDLYALAATTVHLLSHRHPADLPVRGMALQFADAINASRGFTRLLQEMLTPHVEDRISSAQEVLGRLDDLTEDDGGGYEVAFSRPDEELPPSRLGRILQRAAESVQEPEVAQERAHPPPKMRSTVDESTERLRVELAGPTLFRQAMVFGSVALFACFGLVFVAVGLSDPAEEISALIFGGIFTTLCLAALVGIFANMRARSTIVVSSQGLTVRRTSLGRDKDFVFQHHIPIRINLETRQVQSDGGRVRTVYRLGIGGGGKSFTLGDHIQREEIQYLVGRLRKRLAEEQERRQEVAEEESVALDWSRSHVVDQPSPVEEEA